MSDSYDDYELKMQLAEHAWEIKEARHTFRKNRIKENKMSREAMQQALEALESDPISHAGLVSRKQAITALRQALETEREWVGLTADEIWRCNRAKSGSAVEFHICYAHQNLEDFAESLEAKLREKNHG